MGVLATIPRATVSDHVPMTSGAPDRGGTTSLPANDRMSPEPRAQRSWLGRVPPAVVDVVLAVLLGVAITVAIQVSPRQGAPPNALTYALGLTIAALVLMRRRWPLGVLLASAAALFVFHLLDSPSVWPALPLSVALANAWAAGHRLSAALVVAWFGGSPLIFWAVARPERLPVVLNDSVPDLALFATALLLGDAVRTRRALAREHRLLLAEQERSERLLLNVLPAPIAARLKETDGVVAERFDDVTVLFADIVNFTQRTKNVSPDRVVETLDDLFSAFDELANARGLEKIKTIGDAYMVVGGVPTPRADHAEAIADMALAMRDEVATRSGPDGAPLEIRIGIDTGPVVAGVIGKSKFSYDLWGDTVNTASRMEATGVPGAIQVTARTYVRLRDAFRFERRGIVDVKGKGEVLIYVLRGRRSDPDARLGADRSANARH